MSVRKRDVVCAGCGKPLVEGEDVVRIVQGDLTKSGKVRSPRVWAWLHKSCFRRSIRSPEAALEEIRSQVRGLEQEKI